MAETVMMSMSDTSALSNLSASSGSNKDILLLTEFTNLTDDDVFDGALKMALAVSLEQSPFLDIFPDAQTRKTLLLMGRSADERVTPELGREICQRKGMKAYIAGNNFKFGSKLCSDFGSDKRTNGRSRRHDRSLKPNQKRKF